jgi:hypothetical protein
LRINVLTTFSYTIETVLQATHSGLAVVSVPIEARPTHRPSRLFSSLAQFLFRSALTILSLQVRYRPLAFFLPASLGCLILGVLPIGRFVYLYVLGNGDGHVQSLVIGGVIFLTGVLLLGLAMLAHLCAVNRSLLERQQTIQRKSFDSVDLCALNPSLLEKRSYQSAGSRFGNSCEAHPLGDSDALQ